MFFADTPAVHDEYKNGIGTSVKYGVAWPTHDPMPLVAAMAAATSRLGIGVTLSIYGTPPYLAVRRISTLDALSRGRIGWNIVTGHLRAERRAIGAEDIPHDQRYDLADEYMAICYALWDSIAPGAIVRDPRSGIFADPGMVTRIDYHGTYLNCMAASPTMPSRQGRPVIFQAGASARGMEFAVKHAEIVFAIQPTVAAMQRFMTQADDAGRAVGRADRVPVLFGVPAGDRQHGGGGRIGGSGISPRRYRSRPCSAASPARSASISANSIPMRRSNSSTPRTPRLRAASSRRRWPARRGPCASWR